MFRPNTFRIIPFGYIIVDFNTLNTKEIKYLQKNASGSWSLITDTAKNTPSLFSTEKEASDAVIEAKKNPLLAKTELRIKSAQITFTVYDQDGDRPECVGDSLS